MGAERFSVTGGVAVACDGRVHVIHCPRVFSLRLMWGGGSAESARHCVVARGGAFAAVALLGPLEGMRAGRASASGRYGGGSEMV